MNSRRIVTGIIATIFFVIGMWLFAGCAAKPKPLPQFSAPTSSGVQKSVASAKTKIESAKSKAVEVAKTNDLPLIRELVADLESANAEAAKTEMELANYIAGVEAQTQLLNNAIDGKNAALEKAEYWQAKHGKALRELWIWRLIAAGIVASVGIWFALRMGWKLA